MQPSDVVLIEHHCEKMIYQYSALVDQGAWDRVAEMFTEDGRFARPPAPDEIIVGRQNIHASYASRPPSITQHVVSNVVVDVQSETTGSALSTVLLYLGEPGDPVPTHKQPMPLVGKYADRFRLENGVWLFSERLGSLTLR